MREAIGVNLIYKEDVINGDPIMHTLYNIKAFNRNPTENRVYKNYELGLKTTTTLYVKQHYAKDYENGVLTYVEIEGKRYKINIVTQIKGMYIYLNIGELT